MPDMSPLLVKLAFAVVIFLAAALGGLVPLTGTRDSHRSHFMSWGNAFAAGIFLGTGLIHMLGEAHRAWDALGWEYPMPLLLAAVGFMLFLLVEHVLLPADAHSVAHAHSGHELPSDEVERLTGSGIPHALLLALSIHSVIAGIALGGQGTFSGAFYIFLAIIAHKSSAAFALGVALRRSTVAAASSLWQRHWASWPALWSGTFCGRLWGSTSTQPSWPLLVAPSSTSRRWTSCRTSSFTPAVGW